MIEFRKGKPGDGALIASTRQKCWDATYRGIFPDEAIDEFDFQWHTARDEKRLADPSFNYFLVMDGEACVGYFSFGSIQEGIYKDFRFHLQSLYLLKQYQGRGIGKRMMVQVFASCRKAGADKLFWECSPHNAPAIGFYTHLGAVMTELDSGHANPQEDACYFEYTFT